MAMYFLYRIVALDKAVRAEVPGFFYPSYEYVPITLVRFHLSPKNS